jgi:hypothetical protein
MRFKRLERLRARLEEMGAEAGDPTISIAGSPANGVAPGEIQAPARAART